MTTSAKRLPNHPPDLQTQLETILHAVWLAEADWQLSDRIDLATQVASRAETGG